MANDENTKRFGRAVTMLIASFSMLLAVHGCSKSETEQSAAEPAGKVMEKAGDTLDQVTEKTKTIANEAVQSAGEVADKAAQTAKDAYDAAGNAVKETTEKAKDAYQAADRMVSDAVKTGSDQAPSASEMENPMKDSAGQGGDSVETNVNKALESVPSLPGK